MLCGSPVIITICVLPIRSDQLTDQGHYYDPREVAEPPASTRLSEHSRTPGLPLTSTNSLEYSKASGLSSSGYELSQYMNGADQIDVDYQSLLPPPPSCFDPGRHTGHNIQLNTSVVERDSIFTKWFEPVVVNSTKWN